MVGRPALNLVPWFLSITHPSLKASTNQKELLIAESKDLIVIGPKSKSRMLNKYISVQGMTRQSVSISPMCIEVLLKIIRLLKSAYHA